MCAGRPAIATCASTVATCTPAASTVKLVHATVTSIPIGSVDDLMKTAGNGALVIAGRLRFRQLHSDDMMT